MKNKKLEVNGLQISFRTNNGTVKAVRNISFDLYSGETLAIVGESGSGKSVTARAVMGILAPNAIIDGGQIIYNGKDLLSLPEDEFHTLRGNKLSMIFQDPLSSLNPIVQIGRQLTEAMILNNKERRRSAQRNLHRTLNAVQKAITEADGANKGREASAQLKTFRSYAQAGNKLETSYDAAVEAAEQFVDDSESFSTMMSRYGFSQENMITLGDLKDAAHRAYDDYVVSKDDIVYQQLLSKLDAFYQAAKKNQASTDDAIVVQEIAAELKTALALPKPDFFMLGCLSNEGHKGRPDQAACDRIEGGFLTQLRSIFARAIHHTHDKSKASRAAALVPLKEVRAELAKGMPAKASAKSLLRQAEKAVRSTYDPLDFRRESPGYVMAESLERDLERYYKGLKNNPREEKRYQKDKRKYDELIAKGRAALKVVPAVLIDTDAAHRSILDMLDRVIGDYERRANAEPPKDCDTNLLNFLRTQISERAIRVSKTTARHRAIKLMEEVGIPEPRKRYRQYPFQFSGGMRQRIVIAIALSANPDILICDEPTTALDVTIQAQILELITDLKKRRNLSVIFITHDLGVVANMADCIVVMYAGKIVEYGTADDMFYEPKHPYTWALLASMPDLDTKERLAAIPGTPPNMIMPPVGDAFAARNKYAMQIDFEEQPPFFRVSDTHYAATWLLSPEAPHVEPPSIVTDRIRRMKSREEA